MVSLKDFKDFYVVRPCKLQYVPQNPASYAAAQVFFFYPLDFTFVCPTEIIAFSDRIAEFEAIGVKVRELTCSGV